MKLNQEEIKCSIYLETLYKFYFFSNMMHVSPSKRNFLFITWNILTHFIKCFFSAYGLTKQLIQILLQNDAS